MGGMVCMTSCSGVLVTEVKPLGAAGKAGVLAEDVLVEIAGHKACVKYSDKLTHFITDRQRRSVRLDVSPQFTLLPGTVEFRKNERLSFGYLISNIKARAVIIPPRVTRRRWASSAR